MARRRTNGEGTLTKRKDGRYEARIYVPTPTGRKRICLYDRTQAAVRKKLLAVQQDIVQGTYALDAVPRLDTFLDYWLEEVIRPNKRPATYADYKWFVDNYLRPDLGAYTLDQLTISLVQKWLNKVLDDGASTERPANIRKVSADRIDKLGRY
jgi:hypothetical protein